VTEINGVNNMPVKSGDRIKVEYEGTLDDGTVFETSELRGRPLEILVGAGQVIKGFEKALIGMKKGEEKKIKIQPSEAFGTRDPELIQKVSKDQFPENMAPKIGSVVTIGQSDGSTSHGRIIEVTDEAATVDLNHRLAGKELNFKIKVVDIL
jgi:FKBP-type peptidyl-prolyl cis-trans isomerase 2